MGGGPLTLAPAQPARLPSITIASSATKKPWNMKGQGQLTLLRILGGWHMASLSCVRFHAIGASSDESSRAVCA